MPKSNGISSRFARTRPLSPRIIAGGVAAAALLGLSVPVVRAAPLGEAIIQGSATISRNGSATTVQQTSSRAVINWNSFNLAAEEAVNFILPTAHDATLNRILDPNPSTISGTIQSNGTVYFSNPNGLVFDATSRVSANGFVATTSAISSFDFMNSPLEPKKLIASGTATIQLNGSITANQITAIGPVVGVAGTLNGKGSTHGGDVTLSSSTYSWVGKNAVISANAGCDAANCAAETGHGGNVMVWSDGTTHYFGKISATG
ncbi:MAG: filamentous hemagglutinin N-terminal domain-containing protein, partial [Alphaproteobacteria bacterium]|nr:filamentous hemagglutinin N-terminal domain-containing protein [Alphaproteobacteria bacterium]